MTRTDWNGVRRRCALAAEHLGSRGGWLAALADADDDALAALLAPDGGLLGLACRSGVSLDWLRTGTGRNVSAALDKTAHRPTRGDLVEAAT